jgi:alanyl-tRNA synthetase
MELDEVRSKYLAFFEKRGHKIIPSSSLVPENDPTTLFTGSGMQPLIPYLLGEKHPLGSRLANSQKCFRTQDIEEVGDNRHTTFFEMLGNWSLGDYFKQEQIQWFWEFLTKEIGLNPDRIFVTCYIGNVEMGIPKDTESAAIWREVFSKAKIEAKEIDIGSEERGYKVGEQGGRIFFYTDKNWWSRTGGPASMPVGEPGGPDTEMFYLYPEVEHDQKWGRYCHPNCDCGRYMELGNSVFMEYVKDAEGFKSLPQKNVDYGGGLERITAAANDFSDIFLIAHGPLLEHLEKISGKTYASDSRSFRILGDHMKATVFLIAQGVHPSNTDQGYFVRRLIRRSVVYADRLGIKQNELSQVAKPISLMYMDVYPEMAKQIAGIIDTIDVEEQKFRKTLKRGLRLFREYYQAGVSSNDGVYANLPKYMQGRVAFELYTTHGFPRELIDELAKERDIIVNWGDFEELMQNHQELSRKGAEQKFKGGLADMSEKTTMLHTVTHLMLAGLRKYLGDGVHQAGSNITVERTRFDFTYPEKVNRDTLDKVEAYVNEAIQKRCGVVIEKMQKDVAQKRGVEGTLWERYPDEVNVYMIMCEDGSTYSQELCGGPHVGNTSDIQGTFKITKEEAVAAGIRRVRAILE